MDKKEQDILKKIKEKTEDIKAPDSISPDMVGKMLEQKEHSRTTHKRRWINPSRIAAVAACMVLVAGMAAAVIFLTGRNTGNEQSAAGNKEAKKISKELQTAKNYDQIYSYLKEYQDDMATADMYSGDTGVRSAGDSKESASGAAPDSNGNMAVAPSEEAKVVESAADSASGSDYSSTNVRQEGVDEADITKTDGRYLYVLKDNRMEIAVVDTEGGNLKEVGSMELAEDYAVEEFYINTEHKKLVAVCSVWHQTDQVIPEARPLGGFSVDQSMAAVTFDITDPSQPKELKSVTQSGSYKTSRMSGDYLYLFSTSYPEYAEDKKDTDSYIPFVNGEKIASDSIYLPPFTEGCMYEVITAVDIENPGEITDSKAIFTTGGELYVSNDNIYYYENEWILNSQKTTLRKIAYKDGRMKAVAQGSIKGTIHDSFCIDEYKGNLRAVTTYGNKNAVYVMDETLDIIGSIEDLAKDERVYSARFMGDVGYFVTFRETDPLFSVDLSDPTKPNILGELKIPGFSDYLHAYGENQLLGIGMSVDEKTQVTDGVKLTMFDTTDKADVKEANTYVMENVFSTDVSYDYKAAMIAPEKNLIGFAGDEAGGQHYYLFRYTKDGFECVMNESINGNEMLPVRGIYIEDTLYVIRGNIIESYDLKEYKKIDDIIL